MTGVVEHVRTRGAEWAASVRSRPDLLGGTILLAILALWGAWDRRWIADDGLIVLRTVRNILAGNGPVFNVGERVEANTSTLWTYVITAAAWVTRAPLEYLALLLAMIFFVGAAVFAYLGAARLHAGAVVLLPAGVLAYLAIPPARDFATSGLESSMVLCWIAMLWWLGLGWARARDENGAASAPRVLFLAFVAGLAPLVRPEMAILGLAFLIYVLVVTRGWRMRALVAVAAGVVPVGYQVFRMAYYGVPYPNTAVAKDAAGAKWAEGADYIGNTVNPYLLWIPLALLLVAGILAFVTRPATVGGEALPDGDAAPEDEVTESRRGPRVGVVVGIFVAFGLFLLLYVWRVGGDFMHGRMVLPVVFTLLLPVAGIPLRRGGGTRRVPVVAGVMAVLWGGVAVWAVAAVAANPLGSESIEIDARTGIVDERAFWTHYTGHRHALLAADFMDYTNNTPSLWKLRGLLENEPPGGLILSYGGDDPGWHRVPPLEGEHVSTVVHLNLGFVSMNVPLDVRVVDPMGLAYPLAAHTERLEDGRIGHDKHLWVEWVFAEAGVRTEPEHIVPWLQADQVRQAEVAMGCPDVRHLMRSYKAPLTWSLAWDNLTHAFSNTRIVVEAEPRKEILRCGLPMPPPVERPQASW